MPLRAQSYFFCFLERHAKIEKRRQTPFCRKVSGRKKKERKERKRRKIMPSLVGTTSASARKPSCAHTLLGPKTVAVIDLIYC